MTNFLNKLWPALLALYIISPLDAHPLLLDDLFAAGVLIYILFKNKSKFKQQQQYYNQNQSQSNQSQQNTSTGTQGHMGLNQAYSLLGVTPANSLDEISRAYKDKMSKSHPDKVSHLNEQLQEKAKELTLELNEAYSLIKNHKA